MLYVTTRNKHDPQTAAHTMNYDRGSDGGLFVPYHMPRLSGEDISELERKSFGQNVADILNLFFSSKLTGWDVEACIGRRPVGLRTMNFRLIVAEAWRNVDWRFSRTVESLAARIHPDGELVGAVTDWVEVAVRIAVLFGIYGELLREGTVRPDRPVDIAVSCGNFAAPAAVWYAREMGLNVGTIICGCNENGGVWELLHRGELDTDALAVKTATGDCDYAVPPDLERLICGVFGQEEASRFWWSCTEGGTYQLDEEQSRRLGQGMFAAVVSQARVETLIPSVYHTTGYILDPYAALAYGALSDYRARTGTARTALIFGERNPVCCAEAVTKAMHITTAELKKRLGEA